MALFTRAEAVAFQTKAKAAYTAAISGKRYQIKDRTLIRQSTDELFKILNKWTRYIADIDAGRDPDNAVRSKRVMPVGL